MVRGRAKFTERLRSRMPPLRKLWQRRAIRIALITGAVLIVLFLILRLGIGLGVKTWLQAQTVAEIKIGTLDIDPFTGRATLRDLSVTTASGKPLLVPEARVRVALIPLLLGRRELYLEYVTISGVRATVERAANGVIRIAGVPVPQAKDEPAVEPKTWVIGFDRVALVDTVFEFSGYNLTVRLPIASAEVSGRWVLGADEPEFTLQADLAFGELLLQAEKPSVMTVAAAAKAVFRDIRIDDLSAIRVGETELHDLRVAQPATPDAADKPPPAVIRAPRLLLGGIDYDGTGRSTGVDSVLLEAPTLYIARDVRGRWYGLDALAAALRESQRNMAADKGKATTVAAPFAIRIGTIRNSGSIRLTFVDRSVEPPYRETLKLDRLTLADIDSSKPAQWIRVDLAGTAGAHAPLSASVRAQPFARKLSLAGEATLKEFDLPPLSGYTAALMGYHIKSGRLDAKLQISVREDEIGGEQNIVLNNIDVSEADREKMAALQTQLKMPLGSALSMLRDKKNNVRLKLPMSGNIRDPKFHIGDAINRALGKAMRSAALSYATYSLQPFGTLLAVVKLADGAMALRLDPVPFAPGQVNIDAEPARYLERVAALLADRPKVRLRLCPVTTPADSTAGAKDLHALGRARAQAIEEALVTRHGVERKRLFVCHPETTDDAAAKPRVDLVI